jgi:hypothetical protein
MEIELIERQKGVFRLLIEGKVFVFMPLDLFNEKDLLPLPRKIKGSTLGWNVCNGFVSYWQIKKAIKKHFL